ncbi:hypothetical protein C8R31_101777 [Nitrosospira sp. Nsp2]|uniref:hypothetical protein n=1 Tax=Nitrosospira sp. Nsp2 TaxID=136548 RepID=UPI000D321BB8|nr:hypothetical protein [Nitrosospira sp. Nsp2]PTR17613.1 hypothetical protein C8R31_101777 [Nitrosospira sp. Nsp2]
MNKARQNPGTLKILFMLGLVIAGPLPVAGAEDLGAHAAKRIDLAQNSHAIVSPTQFEAAASKNHETVAKYYEDSAAELRAKAEEHKLLLEQYENKSYLYGKKAQDLQSHASALIRKYEQAAEADAKKADTHRRIASRLKENSDTESKLNTANASRR